MEDSEGEEAIASEFDHRLLSNSMESMAILMMTSMVENRQNPARSSWPLEHPPLARGDCSSPRFRTPRRSSGEWLGCGCSMSNCCCCCISTTHTNTGTSKYIIILYLHLRVAVVHLSMSGKPTPSSLARASSSSSTSHSLFKVSN